MNSLHLTLVFLLGVFLFLFFIYPRDRKLALSYARYAVLGIVACLILAPLAWLCCAAFKDKDVLMKYLFLPPIAEWSSGTLNLDNFTRLFEGDTTMQGTIRFWTYVINSLFLATTTTVVQLFFSSMGGYALAKYEFRGKRLVMGFMLGSMMIPGMLLLAPVFKMIFAIGWMDSYRALIIPAAVSVFGMFLFRQAMVGLPNSLIEAARIDGCNEFEIYLNIIMPLVRPMSGAFCLLIFMGTWNAYIGPQIFIQTQAKLTLPVILNQYVGVYQQQYGVFLAGTLLAIIPPAILFFTLQKELISGLTRGAVKG